MFRVWGLDYATAARPVERLRRMANVPMNDISDVEKEYYLP